MNNSEQSNTGFENNHLLERLAQSLADRLAPTLPVSIQLWNAKTIAVYLQRSPAVVLERIVTLPDFPAPIRLPSTRAKSRNEIGQSIDRATGQPLWKAIEVIAWVDSHRGKRVGRPHNVN
ncbi:hypothetical protein [Pandoraea aquatica]|uniref:hypothetical protein n=1 Tax=Pandoraea aquatica TaxID=2508290 RepID=UPI0012416D4D|nr:hypothetical protein [Pandoraea aquatica]